ncbi:lipopolysaccharide biosynthesis protein [Filimonas effusa]|uniref:Polysaccharide biosynthesis protein n=1 Tax=Filimonas effusa TaxID=2508721 RepID=A0A4Q1D3G4_9BACT|nr:oligosaccharide flippase family protein [Filimonas effusa]RXK81849.1 hypothetical protein ESB13_18850 [Filimonas effusa]
MGAFLKNELNKTSLWGSIFQSAGIGVINRLVSIGVRTITIPLLLNYLGVERFGLWMTISSISGYIMFLDFGIGSAIVNELIGFYTEDKNGRANLLITNVLFFFLGTVIILIVATLIALPLIDLNAIFHLKSLIAQHEVASATFIALIMFYMQLISQIVLKIPYTLQKGALTETYILIGNLISLAGILYGVYEKLSLPFLVFFLTGTMLFAAALLIFRLIRKKIYYLAWEGVGAMFKEIRRISKVGFHYLLMQSAGMLLSSLPLTLIVSYHGVGAVAFFGLMSQVMAAVQIPFTVLQQPLWAKLNQFANLRMREAIFSIIKNYVLYAFLYSCLAACFLIFAVNYALNIFLHKDILIPLSLRAPFAIWCACGLIAGGGLGTLIMALGLTKQMAAISVFQLVVFLVTSYWLIPKSAATGAVWSIVFAYTLSFPFIIRLVWLKIFSNRHDN